VSWRICSLVGSLIFLGALSGCNQEQILAPVPSPTPSPEVEIIREPTPEPTASPPTVLSLPPAPQLTPQGKALIFEFEGWAGRPELPDLRYSGTSWGWGYDAHQNTKANILVDWQSLPAPQPTRLAATQPFYGRSAIEPTKQVHDILVPRVVGDDVFIRIDMSRTFAECRHALPGFDDLRPNAQSALASLIFNRGPSMSGGNRVEMRAIRDLVPSRDYDGIALQLRKMERVWSGTSIYNGMRNRREAEARLVETP
jgi:hypothetical protein